MLCYKILKNNVLNISFLLRYYYIYAFIAFIGSTSAAELSLKCFNKEITFLPVVRKKKHYLHQPKKQQKRNYFFIKIHLCINVFM
jgi:hypothetical protein